MLLVLSAAFLYSTWADAEWQGRPTRFIRGGGSGTDGCHRVLPGSRLYA